MSPHLTKLIVRAKVIGVSREQVLQLLKRAVLTTAKKSGLGAFDLAPGFSEQVRRGPIVGEWTPEGKPDGGAGEDRSTTAKLLPMPRIQGEMVDGGGRKGWT
jgi:hypothetical protein